MRRSKMGLGNVDLRIGGPNDATAVACLHADSWRRHYRGAYSDDFLDGGVEADRIEVWARRLRTDSADTTTILAEDDGVLIGFVCVIFDEDPQWGSLVDNLHVAFTQKRAGVGTKLMAEAARSVIRHGPGGMYLWVLEQNVDAQAFYQARGGVFADQRLVPAPGGVAGRLNGSPIGLRYVWRDPAVLAVGAGE
jgi:GNAT superfamily N-acetyltransferase